MQDEEELRALTFDDTYQPIDRFDHILKRGKPIQKFSVIVIDFLGWETVENLTQKVYAALGSIWDDDEMFKKLWPVIVKTVINEQSDVSQYAADQFLRLFEDRVVAIQNQYSKLEKELKSIELAENHRLD